MIRARLLAALLAAGTLAACAGASGSIPAMTALKDDAEATYAPASTIDITVSMIVRGDEPDRAHFVSRSTNGVLTRVYAQANPRRLLGRSVTDVSPGSPACGGKKKFPRTCTVTIPAPPGKDLFLFTTYDVKPVGGRFPKRAHVLGLGSVAKRIVAYRENRLDVYIGGVIAKIGGAPAYASLPADGRHHAFGFVLQPRDFNNNTIVAGGRDPYANPISLSLTQTGGSGHATLSLNGGRGTQTIVSRHSDDRLAMDYDGGGTAGYGITVTISAKGVVPQSVRISPLFVSSASALFANATLGFDAVAQQATLEITELRAPSSTRYTALATGCASVASAGGVTGSGPSASVVVSNGTRTSANGCTIAVSDGSSTVNVPVTNTTSGVGVTVPSVTISEFPIPSANAQVSRVAAGADGAIWFTESNASAGKIGRIPTNATPGSGAQISEYPLPSANGAPFGIVGANDGSLWFTERGTGAVGRIPTNATPGSSTQVAEYAVGAPFSVPQALIAAPDGNLWFTDQIASDAGVMNLGGGVVQAIPLPSNGGGGMAVDASGNVWIATIDIGQLFEVAPNGTVTTLTVPTSSQVQSMAFDAAGNLWLADAGLNAIDELPASATSIVQYPVPGGGSPLGLTVGPDGALWFTDGVRNVVGRMTPSGVFAPSAGYAIPTAASAPAAIVNGPDGALWFAEFDTNNIARILPSGTSSARRR